jgi:hypothetical protein
MTPGMKIAIILGFLFITWTITFVLGYFEVPIALYMPYIYWSLALLTFVLILPQKNESVFNELI